VDFYQKQKKPKILFCDTCGKSMIYSGIGRIAKSCSDKCKNIHDHKIRVSKGDYLKEKTLINCDSCKTEFLTAFDHQRFCSASCRNKKDTNDKSRIYLYKCDECGIDFVTKRHLSGVSVQSITRCKNCQIERQRVRYRKKTLARQGALSNPRISVEIIAKRDYYLCHLCNQIVDMDLKRTDKMGATIDHVLPISKGGLDTMENVALAHWICNIKKGNRV
jgi:predicted nucleic acid-binding Zn ribbon protein/endogenous inhibitor of DNA gyrase (YacG/DUF329 family)